MSCDILQGLPPVVGGEECPREGIPQGCAHWHLSQPHGLLRLLKTRLHQHLAGELGRKLHTPRRMREKDKGGKWTERERMKKERDGQKVKGKRV